MKIKLQPDTIGILKDDYSLKSSQIGYIKRYLGSYKNIPEEYVDATALICGDAYSEALNYNEIHEKDIEQGYTDPMSITRNMNKNVRRYYRELNMDIPKRTKIR